MRLPRLNDSLPPRQRGAYVVLTAVVMLSLVLSVGLALDTGRLHLEKRQLQRVADMAALEAAGAVMLISHAEDGELEEAAQAATKRNGYKHNTDDQPSDIDDIRVEAKGGGVCHEDQGGDGGLIRKFYPFDGGETKPAGACSELERHAVEVTIEYMASPSLFDSLWGDGGVKMTATAMAQRSQAEEYAVFSVGSRLLSVDTEDSVLSHLLSALGLEVSAGVAGLGNIANVNVMLGDILAVNSLGVGSVEQLLGAEITLLDVVEAARLGLAGDDAVSLTVLDNLLGADIGNLKIPLGELLHVSTDDVPLAAEINLLELVSAGLFFANKDSAIELDADALGIVVPNGIANLEVMLNVIEPPRIAIGPPGCQDGSRPTGNDESCDGKWRTSARAEQLSIGVSGDFTVPLLADIRVLLGISAARAEAGIDDLWPSDTEGHDWVVRVSAVQQPVSAYVRLYADVLNTRVSEDPDTGFSEGGFSGGILDDLGIGSDSSVMVSFVDGVLSSVGNLIGGLLEAVVRLIGDVLRREEFRLDPSDATKIQKRTCSLLLVCGSWGPHKNVPTLPEEIGSGGTLDEGEPPDFSIVFEGLEGSGEPEPMTPLYREVQWPSQDDSHPMASFSGDPASLVNSLSSSLASVDLEVSLLGSDDLTSPLLNPVVNLLSDVINLVLRDLIADKVLEPLLELLGVKVQEAEVRIIHIAPDTGPPELL